MFCFLPSIVIGFYFSILWFSLCINITTRAIYTTELIQSQTRIEFKTKQIQWSLNSNLASGSLVVTPKSSSGIFCLSVGKKVAQLETMSKHVWYPQKLCSALQSPENMMVSFIQVEIFTLCNRKSQRRCIDISMKAFSDLPVDNSHVGYTIYDIFIYIWYIYSTAWSTSR